MITVEEVAGSEQASELAAERDRIEWLDTTGVPSSLALD
jgi:hypothetical protein